MTLCRKWRAACRLHQFQVVPSLLFQRFGFGDPTCRIEGGLLAKAFWTPQGPCLLALRQSEQAIEAEMVGEGADWCWEWLERFWPPPPQNLPRAAVPYHSRVEKLRQQHRGIVVCPVPWVLDIAIDYVFQQRVTFQEASKSYARLLQQYGPAAPGPLSLRLMPHPGEWSQIGSDRLQQAGLDSKRAATVLRVAKLGADPRRDQLASLRGVGPWTLAMCDGLGWGDADAVPLHDVHLPHTVCGYLIDQPWHGDDKMLELLEPYRGCRFLLLSWLMRTTR